MLIGHNKKISLDRFIYKSLYDKDNGYYIKKNPFGKKGDFITSPNISFLFSEMISIWLISFWENLKKPKKINIIELGAGNGEMMSQIIKTLNNFSEINLSANFLILEKQLSNFGVNARIFNSILSQIQFERSPLVDYYESRGAEPVKCNKEKLLSEGYYVLQAPLYSKRITPTLRHDPRRLARAVMFIYRNLKKLT